MAKKHLFHFSHLCWKVCFPHSCSGIRDVLPPLAWGILMVSKHSCFYWQCLTVLKYCFIPHQQCSSHQPGLWSLLLPRHTCCVYCSLSIKCLVFLEVVCHVFLASGFENPVYVLRNDATSLFFSLKQSNIWRRDQSFFPSWYGSLAQHLPQRIPDCTFKASELSPNSTVTMFNISTTILPTWMAALKDTCQNPSAPFDQDPWRCSAPHLSSSYHSVPAAARVKPAWLCPLTKGMFFLPIAKDEADRRLERYEIKRRLTRKVRMQLIPHPPHHSSRHTWL